VQEEALDSWGWTPLHYAAWHNKIQMVELLLSHGASVDATDSEASQQHAAYIARFSPHGCSWPSSQGPVHAVFVQGATPLALAACTNRTALTELLMLRGANPAPLVAAVRQSNNTVVQKHLNVLESIMFAICAIAVDSSLCAPLSWKKVHSRGSQTFNQSVCQPAGQSSKQ